MKVIVAGFPKTGTKTMNAALTKLGYNVYDFDNNFHYLGEKWTKIMTTGGTKEDLYNMYKDVEASMDIPFCYFWEEVLEAFPDAKIVFMQRKNEDDWLRSWENQVKSIENHWLMTSLAFISPTAFRAFRYCHHVGRTVFSAPPQHFWATYRGISSTVAKKRYRDHNACVLERAPKDRLLVFSMSEGWEPLCKFLDKPIPSAPFPHRNQRASLVDDLLANSPVFLRMKKEAMISLSILSVLTLAGSIYLCRHPPSIDNMISPFKNLKFW